MDQFINYLKNKDFPKELSMNSSIISAIRKYLHHSKLEWSLRLEFSLKNDEFQNFDFNGVLYSDVPKRDSTYFNYEFIIHDVIWSNAKVSNILKKFYTVYSLYGAFWYWFHYNSISDKFHYNYVNYSTLSVWEISAFINLAKESSVYIDLELFNDVPTLAAIQFNDIDITAYKIYKMYDSSVYTQKNHQIHHVLIYKIYPEYKFNGFHILYRYLRDWIVTKKIIYNMVASDNFHINESNISIFILIWFDAIILRTLFGIPIVAIAFEKDIVELYFDFLA